MSNIPRYMRILGWTAFGLMWIPFILTFVSGDDQDFGELTSPTTIFFALTFVVMFVAMGLLFGSSAVSWLFKKMAESRGERMTARIVDIRPTGTRVNRVYDEVRFDLEINYMGDTVRVSTEKLLSRFDGRTFQNGMTVNVMYDPTTKLVSMLD